MNRVLAPTTTLAAEQVVLRPLIADDAAAFIALAQVSAAVHGRWLWAPKTPEEFAAYIARFSNGPDTALVVCDAGSGGIAGFFTITDIIRGPYWRGTVGYGGFVPTRGRGYMTQGLRRVLGFAFDDLGLHRLEADIQPENLASKRLVSRLQFVYEGLSRGFVLIDGEWRDHERWAMTRERWDSIREGTGSADTVTPF
jgi:[ribosomal protein S5]-alanine N-acetyltransferase